MRLPMSIANLPIPPSGISFLSGRPSKAGYGQYNVNLLSGRLERFNGTNWEVVAEPIQGMPPYSYSNRNLFPPGAAGSGFPSPGGGGVSGPPPQGRGGIPQPPGPGGTSTPPPTIISNFPPILTGFPNVHAAMLGLTVDTALAAEDIAVIVPLDAAPVDTDGFTQNVPQRFTIDITGATMGQWEMQDPIDGHDSAPIQWDALPATVAIAIGALTGYTGAIVTTTAVGQVYTVTIAGLVPVPQPWGTDPDTLDVVPSITVLNDATSGCVVPSGLNGLYELGGQIMMEANNGSSAKVVAAGGIMVNGVTVTVPTQTRASSDPSPDALDVTLCPIPTVLVPLAVGDIVTLASYYYGDGIPAAQNVFYKGQGVPTDWGSADTPFRTFMTVRKLP